jgi:acylglycerol lipase
MPELAGTAGAIHYSTWVPTSPKVLAVFNHGLGEHVGLYEPFAEALNEAGIALWAHDHFGHGRSDGTRALVDDIDHFLDDSRLLLDRARAAHAGLPLVLIGHSLGATLATLLVGERKVRPAALVLAGSSVVQVPGASNALVELLASGVDPMDIRKDPREMVRDEAYAAKIRSDPLTWQGGIRVETLRSLGDAAGRLSTVLPHIDVPTLLVHGAEDDLAPAAGAERAASLMPDARAVIFPDDLHNILNELDRSEVYREIVAFIRAVTLSGSTR